MALFLKRTGLAEMGNYVDVAGRVHRLLAIALYRVVRSTIITLWYDRWPLV